MKKLLQLGLGTALSLSLVFQSEAITFHDVGGHWSGSFIETVVDSGLMSGTSSDIFSPDETMSLGHFAVVVVNGAFEGKTISKNTDSHWADPYLNVLIVENLLENRLGESILTFDSGWQDAPVYRYQVASIVARLVNPTESPNVNQLSLFTDLSDSSSNVADVFDIGFVAERGIMTGVSDTEFGVHGEFTRGACCVVVSQLLQQDILQANEENDSTAQQPEAPETTPEVTTKPVSLMPADTDGDGILSQQELNAVFDSYKAEYPQGTRWTNDDYYNSSKLGGGYGCAGWAFMLSDSIFGNLSKYTITRDELRPGDYFHTGTHFGVIMSIKNGYYITTEGNFNSSIYWDYKRTTSYLTENVKYYSRYPKV